MNDQGRHWHEWGFSDGESDAYQGNPKVKPEPPLPAVYWDAYDQGFASVVGAGGVRQ